MKELARYTKSNVTIVDRDPLHLHPVFRAAVREVELMCEAEALPFRMFEGFRSPQRQDHLYLQGRARSRPGKILTESKAWESLHQFGLAADFAMVFNLEWYFFDPTVGNEIFWTRLHEIGEMYGLEGLAGQYEGRVRFAGHLQYACLELDKLRAGSYPGGGDRSWEENLRWSLETYPVVFSDGELKAPASRSAAERVAP